MTRRQTFLISRACAFAALLITAGATSISVATSAQNDRMPIVKTASVSTEQWLQTPESSELRASL